MNDELQHLKMQYQTSSWKETIVGSLPFFGILVVITLIWLFNQAASRFGLAEPGSLGVLVVLVPILIWYLGTFVAGWVRHFPRWWYSYAAMPVLFSLYLTFSATPGLNIFGFEPGRDLWGWRAWVPFGTAVLLALLLTRSLRPLRSLARGIWYDPSRLTFAAYGLLPFFFWVIYDEVHGSLPIIMILISSAIFTAGAVFYLRSWQPWRRLLSLYASYLIAALINAVAVSVYWDGRMLPWMQEPASGWDNALGIFYFSAYATLVFLGPVFLIELLRFFKRRQPVNLD